MKRVVVIGGGASGMLASISLKQKLKNKIEVILLEKEDRIGKKILKTGNGKCNLTNENLNPTYFNDEIFVESVLNKYNFKSLRDYMSSLGLMMKSDSEGRVYPLSESAASFLDLLKSKVEENDVKVYIDSEVIEIEKKNNKYRVITRREGYDADYVIIATGSKAQIKNYNNSFIRQLELKIENERPALVSVKVKEKIVSLSGLRVKGNLTLTKNNVNLYHSFGEVLFKDDYLSGIVVMSSSRYIKDNCSYVIHLDLLKDYDEDMIVSYLNRLNTSLSGEHILMGVLPKMLAIYILKEASISLNKKLKEFTFDEKKKLATKLKNLEFNVIGVNDYDKAQIVMGGISLSEIDNKTLELYKHHNIYVVGEVMDIDGECGGFNLSWAWASALNVSDNIVIKEK